MPLRVKESLCMFQLRVDQHFPGAVSHDKDDRLPSSVNLDRVLCKSVVYLEEVPHQPGRVVWHAQDAIDRELLRQNWRLCINETSVIGDPVRSLPISASSDLGHTKELLAIYKCRASTLEWGLTKSKLRDEIEGGYVASLSEDVNASAEIRDVIRSDRRTKK